jgi:hypothetical protein
MKRPTVVHFLSIKTDEFISIKASLTLKSTQPFHNIEIDKLSPKTPIANIKLLTSNSFHLKFSGLDANQNEIYVKTQETDSFGNLYLKIPINENTTKIEAIEVFEIGLRKGLELLLGVFIPLKIPQPRKLVISDFDKTLLETRYGSTKEVYHSLITPLDKYVTIHSSLKILKDFIDKGFHPFILSASPHFYEENIRDWLYKKEIFTAGIFLKDYRQVFSPLKGDLRPKDIKLQGLYKLNHLLDIILMTGIPSELVLIGDNFESDPTIYLTLTKILKSELDPWTIWKSIIKEKNLKLTQKQNFLLLNKIFQVNNQLKKYQIFGNGPIQIRIFIRRCFKDDQLLIPEIFQEEKNIVSLYDF